MAKPLLCSGCSWGVSSGGATGKDLLPSPPKLEVSTPLWLKTKGLPLSPGLSWRLQSGRGGAYSSLPGGPLRGPRTARLSTCQGQKTLSHSAHGDRLIRRCHCGKDTISCGLEVPPALWGGCLPRHEMGEPMPKSKACIPDPLPCPPPVAVLTWDRPSPSLGPKDPLRTAGQQSSVIIHLSIQTEALFLLWSKK